MKPPSIIEAVRLNALRHPQKLALSDHLRALTYEELVRRIEALARALQKLGVTKGARVLLAVGNRSEHVESLLAVSAVGGIPVPVDVLSRSEFGRIRDLISPRAVVVEDRVLQSIGDEEAQRLASVPKIVIGSGGTYEHEIARHLGQKPDAVLTGAEDPFLYMVTSGTTGAPKLCSVSQHTYAMRSIQKSIEGSVRTADKHLAILPICFNAGRGAALAHLYLGATTILLPEFDPDAVAEVVEREKITTLMVVPRICAKLLDASASLEAYSTLRRVSCTGAALPVDVKSRFLESVCAELYNSYGSTDTGPIATLAPPDLLEMHGSVGQPTWGVEVATMDGSGNLLPAGHEGELMCRSPYLIDGYVGAHGDIMSSSGWFPTGDVAAVDERGYIFLRSRAKEMIKTGGTTVYPVEVEDTIRLHPGVTEASVFGVPSGEWGEAVVAAVVTKPHHELSAEELKVFCKSRLAPYKVPKAFLFLEKLPYSSMGKVNKAELVSLAGNAALHPGGEPDRHARPRRSEDDAPHRLSEST
jgi:fatty-acyl-CoA synthase